MPVRKARERIRTARRIVVKVGTSTLTYENGRMNLGSLERLCRVLADQMNRGRQVVLVSSGAIGVGMGRLRMKEKPREMREKQAVAAVGQSELMNIYGRLMSEYGCLVGQVLLTRDDVEDEPTRTNVVNTLDTLLEKEVLPIVNENDTVSTEEIYHNGTFGDNDTLSAIVARLVRADVLVLLSDIDGLYDRDPRKDPDARLLPVVEAITPEIERAAGGAGTRRGTGGMRTKVEAARIATGAGVDMVIASGRDPMILERIFDGEEIGTLFLGQHE